MMVIHKRNLLNKYNSNINGKAKFMHMAINRKICFCGTTLQSLPVTARLCVHAYICTYSLCRILNDKNLSYMCMNVRTI